MGNPGTPVVGTTETAQQDTQDQSGTTSPQANTSSRKTHWWQSNDLKASEKAKRAFKGSWHYNGQLRYLRPRNHVHDEELGKSEYKNQYGSTVKVKGTAVETYLSSTRSEPRKLLVQASEYSYLEEAYEWNRRRIEGSVPTALRMSEWALRPAFDKSRRNDKSVRWAGIPLFLLRTIAVAFPLQIYMSFPIFTPPWEEDDAEDTYMDWPGYQWTWPKFAVNSLDMSPDSADGLVVKLSAKPRLLRPRLLMVLENGEWVKKNLHDHPEAWKPYIMVSYANRQFHTNKPESGPDTSEPGRSTLTRIAQMEAREAGLQAYWMDFECRAPTSGELLDSDVNRFSDVVRGASRVVVALPDETTESALVWGKRMWTLPEGLLAPNNKVNIHYVDSGRRIQLTKVEMAAVMWSQTDSPRAGEELQATRQLAEHFNGTLQLSRLQLMMTAMAALWDRKDEKQHVEGELAHALMGFLHTRIDPTPGNTLFQDIAKLSLLNDSDQLVERMVCLLNNAGDERDPFRALSEADAFGTHLWDIHPSCEVVGVDEQDRTIILNGCRAIPIRWKKFPKLLYKKTPSFKKLFAEVFLRSGAWWFLTGFTLIWTYTPLWIWISNVTSSEMNKTTSNGGNASKWLGWTVAFFFAVGLLLSIAGPISLRVLNGGKVMQPAPHLVGFEGTMPIDKLEKVIFGNDDSRLTYEPSSTTFSKGYRDPKERVGTEPPWVTDPAQNPPPALKPGHRLFTLVDTGSLTVSIFEAQRPPTVALICGREGGMLRTVLCSWRYSTDCLYKETVMRMPTDIFHMAKPKGWLKLQLGREASLNV